VIRTLFRLFIDRREELISRPLLRFRHPATLYCSKSWTILPLFIFALLLIDVKLNLCLSKMPHLQVFVITACVDADHARSIDLQHTRHTSSVDEPPSAQQHGDLPRRHSRAPDRRARRDVDTNEHPLSSHFALAYVVERCLCDCLECLSLQ